MNLVDGIDNASKGAARRLDNMDDALPEQKHGKVPFENYLAMARERATTDEAFRAQFENALAEYAVKTGSRR